MYISESDSEDDIREHVEQLEESEDAAVGEFHSYSIVKSIMKIESVLVFWVVVKPYLPTTFILAWKSHNFFRTIKPELWHIEGLPTQVTKVRLRKGQIVGEQKDDVKIMKWKDKKDVMSIVQERDMSLIDTGKITRRTSRNA
ncbi:hypothetical protein HHI36_005178 [Cryptolaemus montrouzieri]|uniref:Uncharacterized protein n=1 Tax=Cryptolaemus montrouzieri TaxID=559131 RepID=A0ABD2NUW3_9CUCU